MRHIIYIIVLAFTFLASCGSDKKKGEQETVEGETVHDIPSPAGSGSSLPVLFSNGKQTILSWVTEEVDSPATLKYSYLLDGTWEEPHEIITGKGWFINWADFPMISANNGNLISHILKRSTEDTYSYDIKLNLLPRGESEWQTDIPLHTDGTKTEHGFVTALPYREDSFFVTWLDGRNSMAGDHEHENSHGAEGAMNIRAAEVSANGTVSNNVLLDGRTCSCCQTTAAITDNGPVVLYRDRSEHEIRDISITRMVNGKWTDPKPIHNDGWKINGCPVNGPKAAAIGNDMSVAWFTAASDKPKVKVTFSADGGEHFDDPIVVSDTAPIGRVDILMLDSENAIVSWMESKEKQAQLKAMKVNKSGKKYTPVIIGTLSDSRKSGFPQMELVDDRVYFAWTDLKGESDVSEISTAYVMLGEF